MLRFGSAYRLSMFLDRKDSNAAKEMMTLYRGGLGMGRKGNVSSLMAYPFVSCPAEEAADSRIEEFLQERGYNAVSSREALSQSAEQGMLAYLKMPVMNHFTQILKEQAVAEKLLQDLEVQYKRRVALVPLPLCPRPLFAVKTPQQCGASVFRRLESWLIRLRNMIFSSGEPSPKRNHPFGNEEVITKTFSGQNKG